MSGSIFKSGSGNCSHSNQGRLATPDRAAHIFPILPTWPSALAEGVAPSTAAIRNQGQISYGGTIGSVVSRGRTLLGPSGELGTFDAGWIEQAMLWMPVPVPGGDWKGLFAYTARSCSTCPPRASALRAFYPLVRSHFRPREVGMVWETGAHAL